MIPVELRQGDTLRRDFVMTYKDTGLPVDLTECNIYCQLRRSPGQEPVLTAGIGILPVEGKFAIVFGKEQIKTLEPGDYGFDVRIESDTDRVTIYTEYLTVVLPYTERE